MSGKLIVIESGSDASGKETQSKILFERLIKEKYNVKKIEYPNYKSKSSVLVKMYLNGDFGDKPEDVDAYIASTFYTVDRFASYKTEWKELYENGGVIIADRYTTSNMVHQASKINDKVEKDRYLDWLCDFEYNTFKLPRPDCVIFLDMPPMYSKMLMKKRENKLEGIQKKDIHESNYNYLLNSYNNALYIADKYNWCKINCIKDSKIRTIDAIHEDIYNTVVNYFTNDFEWRK